MICAVAKVLKQFANENRLIARYGGEEFIFVTFDCNEYQLYELSEELRRSVEKIEGLVLPVTVSVGCRYANALFHIEGTIDQTDKALYQAKKNGRNNTQVYRESQYRIVCH